MYLFTILGWGQLHCFPHGIYSQFGDGDCCIVFPMVFIHSLGMGTANNVRTILKFVKSFYLSVCNEMGNCVALKLNKDLIQHIRFTGPTYFL